ncbi:hypothetical protein BCR25_04990 [Enterococcus termitis]|uniref:Uncharacterized protein n=1 Tax=Enterococcus termitis TaxID=332950 RepID=A0A1E5GKA0_9ENTE|nr:hypothetical protein BCR25_04990 [Enterococcus termitis]
MTDEEFDKLFLEQKRFERKRAENDCSACGYGNKGSIFIESSSDIASLIHFGMWSHGTDYYRCTYCGRKTEK